MERRAFMEKLLKALALGVIFLTVGCQKKDPAARFGNQDKLWQLATGEEIPEKPLIPDYVKNTPAAYRDASQGKVDPSFIPRTGGG